MPGSVEAQLLEAYRAHHEGRLGEAEAGYRRVLLAESENVHALNLLGMLCLHTQRAVLAAELIAAAIAIDDEDPEPHANLALALKELGRLDEAAAAMRRSLALAPDNPLALNNLGNLLAESHRLDQAIECFRAALRIDAGHAEALVNLSSALLVRGQVDAALAAAADAARLHPGSAPAHAALGDALLKAARHEEAAAAFERALAIDAASADATIGLSAACKELAEVERAESLLRALLAREPAHAGAHNNLAVLLEQRGDGAAAAVAFRAAIAAAPRHAQAHYQLAQLKAAAITDDEVRAIQRYHADRSIGDEQRAPLAFALACVHERAGRIAEAFAHLAEAQAIKASAEPYDDERVADFHRRLVTAFAVAMPAPEPFDEVRNEWPQPVFVLGMPRSGTSLTEQVLSSHPLVAGAGELSFVEDCVSEAVRLGGAPFPACVERLSGEQLRRLGQRYRERLLKRAQAPRWLVDKTPMNFQYIGFIAAMLPGARFIHCRRDAMDNCLSIFRLPFESAHAYAHDLRALGLYWRHHDRLVEHWRGIVPGRLISVEYERLVDDFEAQTQRMLEMLGLEWHSALLRFHQTERLVKTPSASQVRRPLYRDSVAAWRRWAPHLAPLAEALGVARGDARA